VIEHGDGTVVTRCVGFGTAQITGQQLLDMAGVAWSGQTFGGFGVAACAIDGEPAHYATCPGKDFYWAIFVSRGGGAWQFASSGISTLNLSGGDAEGFRYVPATGNAATPPSPAGVCASSGDTSATSPGNATNAPPAGGPGAGATPAASGGSGSSATTPTAGATPRGAAGAAGSGSLGADGTPGTSEPAAGATDLVAAAGQSAGATGQPGGQPGAAPAPAQGGGVDLGLLLAAIVGGALAGLALLRLVVARRGVR
jgi:hypothetical protein